VSRLLLAACSAVIWTGCGADLAPPVMGEVGDPLPGLTQQELSRFSRGAVLFDKVFTPDEGLGPAFNENQCSACHTDPVSGGTGGETILKATRYDPTSGCDLLKGSGGENIRTQSTPLLKALGMVGEQVPAEATESGRFTAPFLFGLGLVEAIPDQTILEREDPSDRDGDGISGRAARLPGDRLGRFGRKAEVASIVGFVANALQLEMGLTSPRYPVEAGFNGRPLPAGTDPAADPEIDLATVELLADFVRFLAPPNRGTPPTEEREQSAARGERLFGELGCPSCHVPTMRTGPSDVAALDRKTVALYSDLLLHDMGPDLADICGIDAAPSEVRTQPLMGLRFRDRLTHRARALDVRDAILLHGGEAQRARAAFAALGFLRQQDLVSFLQTL